VCGAALDPAACEQLCSGRVAADYFPAYRAPTARESAAA